MYVNVHYYTTFKFDRALKQKIIKNKNDSGKYDN